MKIGKTAVNLLYGANSRLIYDTGAHQRWTI